MISRRSNQRRGVTLTELLVVLAIISLLATIAVPVYIQKSEQARIAVARQEVREIAEAQQQVFAIHGFFVPIHILDNLPDLPPNQTSAAPRDDFRNDTNLSQKYLMDPLGSLQDLVGNQGAYSLDNAFSNTGDVRVKRLVQNWAGPFLNAQRTAMGDSDQGSLIAGAGGASQFEVSRALVLDPWGFPYRVYSPLGVVGNGFVTQPQTTGADGLFEINVDDGRLTRQDQRFDRWAIVSFGRDGVSDSATGKLGQAANLNVLDDIFYTFGIVAGESFYKAF